MRLSIASSALAAAFVLTPLAAGYAPALCQDFSITNPGTGPGSDWIRKLQAWWDVHSYYPPDALEKKQDGTVKLHLVIHPDGNIWMVDVGKARDRTRTGYRRVGHDARREGRGGRDLHRLRRRRCAGSELRDRKREKS